jgi:hypothetical protein
MNSKNMRKNILNANRRHNNFLFSKEIAQTGLDYLNKVREFFKEKTENPYTHNLGER